MPVTAAQKARIMKLMRGRGMSPAQKMKVMQMMHGSGFFGDIWDFIKSVPKRIVDNKLISKALAFVPGVGGLASGVASALGAGRRRRRRGGCAASGGSKSMSGRRRIVKM